MEMKAAAYSPRTIGLRAAHLQHFADGGHPAPFAVSRTDLIAFLGRRRWKPETRKSYRSSLVGFYGWAEDAGHIGVSPAARLPKVHVPPPVPRPADDDVIVRALALAPARTLLMIRLMAEAGARRAETARVHSRDLELRGLRLHGKGGKDRVVPIPADLRSTLSGLPPGWVFPSCQGGHIGAGYVGKLVSAVLPAGTVPHMLRHAAATAWHDAGLDIADIRPLLGHESVSTTQRYVFVRSDKARQAVERAARRLHAPTSARLRAPGLAG